MILLAFGSPNPMVDYRMQDIIYSQEDEKENAILSDIKITYEINQPSILEFTAPKGSLYENMINEISNDKNSLIEFFNKCLNVWDNNKIIFRGFLLSFEMDIYGNIIATYTSILYKLKYAIASIYFLKNDQNKMLLKDFYMNLYEYSNLMPESIVPFLIYFEVGESIENDNETFVDLTQLDSYNKVGYVFDIIKSIILEKYGGYLLEEPYRENDGSNSASTYIKYCSYKDLKTNHSQIIKIGENILNFSKKISIEEVYDGVVPIGKNNLTIYSGDDAEYSDCVVEREDKLTKNFSNYIFNNFDEINNISQLKEAGKKYLDLMEYPYTIEIQVKVFDLSLTDSSISPIKCGEFIKIESQFHNVNDYFLCTKIVRDLLNPSNSDYTFGSSPPRISELNENFKYDYQNSFFRKQISEINKKLGG